MALGAAMDGIGLGAQIIVQTMTQYLPPLDNPSIRVLLGATGLQESRFTDRVQVGGPAHSFWQMEQGGGVHGVLTADVTRQLAVELCASFQVEATEAAVYAALALPQYDCLACGLARLIYYADPTPLPAVGDVNGNWQYYIRNWRPGKPKPLTWPGLYAQAKEFFDGTSSA